MEDIFEMMTGTDKEKSDEIEIRLGIHLKIAGHETTCPISRLCESYEALEIEVQAIKNTLDRILSRAKELFRDSPDQQSLDIKSDMESQEIWSILSDIADEKLLIISFNHMDEVKRREVAEHVLTKCNVFSGRGAFFSERYDSESGLLE
jgi:hypothetical protein